MVAGKSEKEHSGWMKEFLKKLENGSFIFAQIFTSPLYQ